MNCSDAYDHNLKLDRATQHLNSLELEIQRWAGTNPYRIFHEIDPERGENVVGIYLHSQPSVELALLIGDCVHNLRSALDSLIYELAVAYMDIGPLPEDRAQKLQFPIFGKRAMTDGECRDRIGIVHPDAQAIIKGLQPYERGKDHRGEPLYNTDPLWLLRELSNIDKHRRLHLVLFAVPGIEIGGHNVRIRYGALKEAAIVEHRTELFSYTPGTSDPSGKVDMEFRFEISVAFGQGPPAYSEPVLRGLSIIREHIFANVLPPLVPYLT